MGRMVSLDSLVELDSTMDRFEEMSRHGYSLDRILAKLEEEEESFDEWGYWE